MIRPPRLKKYDEIRVIAPSRSMSIIAKELTEFAKKRLEKRGYKVSFGENVYEEGALGTASVASRLQDLHEAFSDANVSAILTVIGGYNSNQLLEGIDYDLIKNNPKILMGFSDITAITLAIYAKTGLMTYSGPHFSSWGMKNQFEYTIDAFSASVEKGISYSVSDSPSWSDDFWFLDQNRRKYRTNNKRIVLNQGKARGILIGGHLRCMASLQGTEYWPEIPRGAIIFIEEDAEVSPQIFDRLLTSFLQQTGVKNKLGALLIGRFQEKSNMNLGLLEEILQQKRIPANVPVIANLNFGHTTPINVLPIGGEVIINTKEGADMIRVLNEK